MMQMVNSRAFVVVSFFLTGCVSLFPEPSKEGKRIVLQSLKELRKSPVSLSDIVMIDEPAATGPVATTRISVLRQDEAGLMLQDMLAGAEWPESLPKIIQTHLVEALEYSGHFKGIGRVEDNLKSTLLMIPEIRHFDLLEDQGVFRKVQIELEIKMARSPRRDLLAQRVFKSEAFVTEQGLKGVMMAFNQAYQRILDELVQWVLEAQFKN